MTNTRHKLGAHLSIAGGYDKALQRAKDIGANALQIFSASPRMWQQAKTTEEEIKTFVKTKKELNIEDVVFHASYLINLADQGKTGGISKKILANELMLASKLGIIGSVVHTGSFKTGEKDYDYRNVPKDSYKKLISNIEKALQDSDGKALLLLENSGTRKIGKDIEELGKIIKDIKSKRIKVCLDTCHLHAAGYDLKTEKSFNAFLTSFDKDVGLENLAVFHLNDSKDELGSLRDRHENIGEGKVGKQVFINILNCKDLTHIPFIIETPGFDNKGPDKKNLDILKSYIS